MRRGYDETGFPFRLLLVRYITRLSHPRVLAAPYATHPQQYADTINRMASDEQLKFQLALVFYRTERHNINLPYEIKTKCSALWKQATVGKCSDSKDPPPGFFDYVGKHRWYVQLVIRCC